MTNRSHNSQEDRLGRQLKREAIADQPPISPTLHARIMCAVDQQGRVELAKTTQLRVSRTHSRLRPVAVAGVVIAAVLPVAMLSYLARPGDDLVVVDTSRELNLEPAVELTAPRTAAVTDFTDVAGLTPDDLVDTVLLTHWNYLDQHTEEIATFLLELLPIDVPSAALE